jgi:hypothetical protein
VCIAAPQAIPPHFDVRSEFVVDPKTVKDAMNDEQNGMPFWGGPLFLNRTLCLFPLYYTTFAKKQIFMKIF